MTVSELIKILKQQPQNLSVVFHLHSEYMLLEADDIKVEELCKPRPDGWVHCKRPDKETQTYLVLS